jgi:signal transduction histidine kinase
MVRVPNSLKDQRWASWFDLLTEKLTALLWTTDRELRFAAWRGPALPALGLTAEAMDGATVADIFGAEHVVVEAHRRALAGESPSVAVDAGGTAYEVRLKPLRDEAGRIAGVYGLVVDVTPVRRLEDARDENLRTISHDLRGPLSVISGHAQILQRELQRQSASERAKASGASILKATRRMNTMIDELVDSARLEAGRVVLNRRPVRLETLLDRVRDRVGATLPAERLDVDLPPGLPSVIGDPDRLERVLVNLLLRAARIGGDAASRVALAATSEGAGVRLAITSSGEIPRHELPHLFDKLHRGKDLSHAEGLGLDLYIAKLLVEAHGGTITVESAAGGPTTFAFDLPLA